MATKSSQLQIRVSEAQKREIKRRAQAARRDVSAWALDQLLPPNQARLEEIVGSWRNRSFMLAELNDYLTDMDPEAFVQAVQAQPQTKLPADLENYVAAMIETAAARKKLEPPAWVLQVAPLATPFFASPLKNLKLHLLTASPAPFRRRNIFIDSTLGDRV